MSDKIFADGMFFKRPRDGAPEYVKGSVSIKVADFIPFVEKHTKEGWVNLDLKESKGNKLYFELNTWSKEQVMEKKQSQMTNSDGSPVPFPDDIDPNDIPF